MPQLTVIGPQELIDEIDHKVFVWNKSHGLTDRPKAGNQKWSRSNVACKLLCDALGVECPSIPTSGSE